MLYEMCGFEVSDIYNKVTQKVIAELSEQFLKKGVSLKVLSKLEKLWREKLEATECVIESNHLKSIKQSSANNHLEEIETPNSPSLNGVHVLISYSNDKKKVKYTKLKPLLSSNRLLTARELEAALQNKQKLLDNKLKCVEQTDGCNGTSDDEFETDDFIDVTNNFEQSDHDNIDDIQLDDDELDKTDNIDDKIDIMNAEENKDINQSSDDTDDTCSDEEINSNDEVPDFDPHWEECRNTIYCTSSNIKLIKTSMKFGLALEKGVMHVEGKDYVFKKLNGSSFWR